MADVPTALGKFRLPTNSEWANGTISWWGPWQWPGASLEAANPLPKMTAKDDVAVARSDINVSSKATYGVSAAVIADNPLVPGAWRAQLFDRKSKTLAAEMAFPVVPVHPTATAFEELDGLVGQFWNVVALCRLTDSGSPAAAPCRKQPWSAASPGTGPGL